MILGNVGYCLDIIYAISTRVNRQITFKRKPTKTIHHFKLQDSLIINSSGLPKLTVNTPINILIIGNSNKYDMDKHGNVKRSITAEKVIEIYQKKGEEITLENAENVLNLLYFLAKLVVTHHLKT